MIEYRILIKAKTTNPQTYWTVALNPDGTEYVTDNLADLKIKYTELLQTYNQHDLKAIQDLTVSLNVEITDAVEVVEPDPTPEEPTT